MAIKQCPSPRNSVSVRKKKRLTEIADVGTGPTPVNNVPIILGELLWLELSARLPDACLPFIFVRSKIVQYRTYQHGAGLLKVPR